MGDQIEYRPPTDSGKGIIDASLNPKALAPSELAVTTIEFFSVLFFPSHFRQERVSSVASDFEERIEERLGP